MRRSSWLLALFALGVLASCGGQDDVGVDGQALLPDCNESMLGTGDPNTTQCSGPWEYSRYNGELPPCYNTGTDGNVCGWNATCYPTCQDPSFGVATYKTVTLNGTWSQTQQCERVCEYQCDPPCEVPLTSPDGVVSPLGLACCRNVCWDECYPVDTCTLPSSTTVTNEINKYPEQYRSAIVVTSNTTTCTTTLSNVPDVYKSGSGPVCGAGYGCQPKTCAAPAFGERQCAIVGGTTAPTRLYSSPGLTLAQLKSGDAYVVSTSDAIVAARPVCTTADDLPFGDATQLREKWKRAYLYWNKSGAMAKDPAFRSKITGKMKLMFETRAPDLDASVEVTPGSFVNPKASTQWYYQSLPDERPRTLDGTQECGNGAATPRAKDPIAASNGFEGTSPLSGWSLSGNATYATDAHGGSYAAMVGPGGSGNWSYVARSFTVPTGGQLTFWYKAVCPVGTAATEGASWRVYDNVTRADVVNTQSTPSCAGTWTQVTLDLSAAVGHEVSIYLRNYDNPADAYSPYTLYDDVAWSWAPGELDGLLGMCDRLNQKHAPTRVTEYLATTCLNLANNAKGLPSTYATRQGYLDAYASNTDGFLAHAASDLVIPGKAPGTETQAERTAVLRTRLGWLSTWFAANRSSVYATKPALWKETGNFVKGVWNGATKRSLDALKAQYGIPNETPTRYATALDDYVKATFTADRDVMLAAFPADTTIAAPVTSAPLVFVLADAVRPVAERLGDVALYQDLGCRFRACGPSAPTEVSQLMAILGGVPTTAELQTAVTNATRVRTAGGDDWKAAFDAVRIRHDKLEGAVVDARSVEGLSGAYTADMLVNPWTDAPPPIATLSAIVRDARKRTDSFGKTGRFLAGPSEELAIGLQKAKQDQIKVDVNTRITDLQGAMDGYNVNRQAVVNAILAEIGNQTQWQSIKDRIDRQAILIEQQSGDLNEMRLNAEIDQARLASFAVSYEAAIDKLNQDPNFADYKLDIVTPPTTAPSPVVVAPSHAKWTGPSKPTLVTQVARDGWTFRATKGEVVNFDVSGAWSPTCAVANSGTLENGKTITLQTATTGPAGFEIQVSQSGYDARSHGVTDEVGHYNSYTENSRACAGVKVSTSAGFDTPWGGASAEAYAMAETCVGTEYGRRESETTTDSVSNGSETRNTAAFSYGLRLKNTPFPEYPAGSLLLVRMVPGTTQLTKANIRDIQVMQAPATTSVMNEDSDVYLVVNDLKSTACTPATTGLTVTTRRLVPVGAYAKALGTAMGTSLTKANAEAKRLIQQNRISPEELNSIRTMAYGEIAANCPVGYTCDLTKYPQAMSGIFDTWVSVLLRNAERQVAIRSLARQMEVAMLELKTMKMEAEQTARQSRLLTLAPTWALQTLAGERTSEAVKLQSRASDLVTAVYDRLYPVIHFRYPGTVTLMEQSAYGRSLLDQLTNVDYLASAYTLAGIAKNTASELMSQLSAATASSQDTGYILPVAVAYDNPDYLPPLAGEPPYNPYRKADPDRAKSVWDALRSGQIANLTVYPQDLINKNGGAAQLVCTKEAPIVHSVGFYIESSDTWTDAFNQQSWYLPLQAGPDMIVPTALGAEAELFTEFSYLADQLRAWAGPAQNVGTVFPLSVADTMAPARGVSPFTTWEVNTAALRSLPFDPFSENTKSVILYFYVDPRNSSGSTSLSWLSSCK